MTTVDAENPLLKSKLIVPNKESRSHKPCFKICVFLEMEEERRRFKIVIHLYFEHLPAGYGSYRRAKSTSVSSFLPRRRASTPSNQDPRTS